MLWNDGNGKMTNLSKYIFLPGYDLQSTLGGHSFNWRSIVQGQVMETVHPLEVDLRNKGSFQDKAE